MIKFTHQFEHDDYNGDDTISYNAPLTDTEYFQINKVNIAEGNNIFLTN